MVASELDGIGTEHLSELEHMGYDYVEMPLAEMMRLDGPNFLELKRRVDRLTIGCEVCNNFFPKTHETNRTRGSYGFGIELC